LVRHVRQCSFPESLDWLSDAFSVKRRRRPKLGPRRLISDGIPTWEGTITSALENAARIYHQSSESRMLDQWLDSRKLPRELAQTAELSFSNGRTLVQYLKTAFADAGEWRIQLGMLEDVGLVKRLSNSSASTELFDSVDARYRDFFFDSRVIFPIRTLTGDMAGFAARQAGHGSKSSAKYLYSPGLPRASLLYRGDKALGALRQRVKENRPKELFICEGLVDALRLELTGVPAVSILGAQASNDQLGELQKIADAVAPAGDLKVCLFLDRDKAGIQGSAKLAVSLAERGFDACFIWPTEQQLDVLGVQPRGRKDPDALIVELGDVWDKKLFSEIQHPTALAVISAKLGTQYTPDDIVDDESWSSLSLGVRYRAAKSLSRDVATAEFLLSTGVLRRYLYEPVWFSEVVRLRSSAESEQSIQNAANVLEFIEDVAPRLNIARALAKSGADRGEVPTDEAAWRRLDLGATAFRLGLKERLGERFFEPMEPFDAVHVARDFSKTEPRLKTMPCPEDLVLQQYMLSESLTERFDSADSQKPFSHCVPAVRFYRSEKTTLTTAEDRLFEPKKETLSFAYQIDMEVLEGRSTASNQGMFRPYIECWREYISALKYRSSGFDEVFALRLDLKRYYDRLHRSTVRDALKRPLEAAFERLHELGRIDEFAPPFVERHSLSDSVVDWFCDQSFDYEYYHPDTGDIKSSNPGVGIPQGPVLSAWLATVALFPLDAALRKLLGEINSEGALPHAVYARYVDDIFLVADSQMLLERLRSAVEDACGKLRVEAIPKGDMAQRMTPSEFSELLTEGRALFGSGPTQEVGLLPLGDGEAGYETWHETVERSSALGLLNDRRLYELETETIKEQVFTALNAHDLRPGELPKAARWIWYAAARGEHESVVQIWGAYWSIWTQVTQRLRSRLGVEGRPWHDPSLYALDGLERLLSSSSAYDKQLPKSAEEDRLKCLSRLSNLVLLDGFFEEFVKPNPAAGAPVEAGKGLHHLRRMFLQRSVGVRWIARQLAGRRVERSILTEMAETLDVSSTVLRASLVRAWMTDAEGATFALPSRAAVGRRGKAQSALRPLFLWLHEAIVLMGREPSLQEDQLAAIDNSLDGPSTLLSTDGNESKFYQLLQLWLPEHRPSDEVPEGLVLDALSTILAVCHTKGLVSCLARRAHLMGSIGRLLPSLPGISVAHLVAVCGDAKGDDEELRQIKHVGPERAELDTAVYRDATAHAVRQINLHWEDENFVAGGAGQDVWKRLSVRRTTWASVANQLRLSQPIPKKAFSHGELLWAADCFEALARINYDLEREAPKDSPSEVMEFVPAWPYISSSRWAGHGEVGTATFSLVGPVVRRTTLANFSFARDGSGRLRTHEVPLGDAELWRVGYAVTDLMGLSDELERFRALEERAVQIWDGTSRYVLSRLLSRLRGDASNGKRGHRHPDFPHLTGTTHRALHLLRSFPKDGSAKHELWFLLCIESETVAMRLKSTGHDDNIRRGVLASLLSEIAQAVFARLSERQLHALPAMPAEDGPYGVERRSVAAWRLLDRRLAALEAYVEPKADKAQCAWAALRTGIRVAAVTAWIRSLVFEIQTSGLSSISNSASVPIEWAIENPALSIDEGGKGAVELFKEALAPEGRLGLTAYVTPLGWLALLAIQLGLYDDSGRKLLADASGEIASKMSSLASALASSCPEDSLADIDWPFDASYGFSGVLDETMFDQASALLSQVQSGLKLRVHSAHARVWGLQQQARTFTDRRGQVWKLARGMVDQTGRDKHVETVDGLEESHRVWTETTWASQRLVGVSVLGSTFARTAGMNEAGLIETSNEPFWTEQAQEFDDDAAASEEPSEFVERVSSEETQGQPLVPRSQEPIVSEDEISESAPRPHSPDFFEDWKKFQRTEWMGKRRSKSLGHVRFALFQFRVDDSYYHPLLDAGFPGPIHKHFCTDHQLEVAVACALSEIDAGRAVEAAEAKSTLAQRARACLARSGTEARWTQSALVPSWNEHRRRRLIQEAIEACEAFQVELLVLPEYSVRPDTVEWLRDFMETRDVKVAVVAGTYRLHGHKDDLHFTNRFGKIFGISDAARVFEPTGPTVEKSAFITLLQPMQVASEEFVTVFSRRKKYHSMAMNELINPSREKWEPLLQSDRLIEDVNRQLLLRHRTQLDAVSAVGLVRKLKAADRTAELICSELFASTHPVNQHSIQQEYESLLQRFGHTRLDPTRDAVSNDVGQFTQALLHNSQVDRRTIIVVPACTTRSADYWIYGQSALLAAGLTTVFCAAVLGDGARLEGGGSCVIGKSSWAGAKDAPGKLILATPYSGWSRGIYYSKQSDALGPKEQAMVIVDIDPVYMNEGKPRPQALAAPIQLVAHLPVVEMVEPERLNDSYVPANGGFVGERPKKAKLPMGMHERAKVQGAFQDLGEYVQQLEANRLLNATTAMSDGVRIDKTAEALAAYFGDPTGWAGRLDCWRRNWRELPFYGPPPALIDWLPVDLSPNGGLATVFVPPWGGDEPLHEGLKKE
jgi:hypothetical protein